MDLDEAVGLERLAKFSLCSWKKFASTIAETPESSIDRANAKISA